MAQGHAKVGSSARIGSLALSTAPARRLRWHRFDPAVGERRRTPKRLSRPTDLLQAAHARRCPSRSGLFSRPIIAL